METSSVQSRSCFGYANDASFEFFLCTKKINTPKMWFTIIQNSDQQDLEQHAQSGGIAGFTKALGREWPSCNMSILILQDMSIDKKVESVCFGYSKMNPCGRYLEQIPSGILLYTKRFPPPKRSIQRFQNTDHFINRRFKGVTAEIAKSFARRGRCNLILFSRTQPNNHPLNEKLSKEQIRQELTFAGEKNHSSKN